MFLKEAGEKILKSCIKFDSSSGRRSVYEKGEIRIDYAMYYTFSYPGVNEAAFPLIMYYSVYSGKGQMQSGRFLRPGKTDLPEGIKSKGTKVISFEEAKKNAIKKNPAIAGGNSSFVLGPDYFYWHFSFSHPDPHPGGDALKIISENVIVNPYNGKVISAYTD